MNDKFVQGGWGTRTTSLERWVVGISDLRFNISKIGNPAAFSGLGDLKHIFDKNGQPWTIKETERYLTKVAKVSFRVLWEIREFT